ncbi:MAG: hypothetical protein AB1626_03695, partial [Candidatus Micrarchaeota archaeon]
CLIQAESRYLRRGGGTPVIQVDNTKPVSAKELLRWAGERTSDFVNWSSLLQDRRLAFLLKERL